MLRIAPPLPQLRAHDPCGHWHKGGGDTAHAEERFAANCWEPTIATDGTSVLYVITGRHRPNALPAREARLVGHSAGDRDRRQAADHRGGDG